MMKKLSRLKLNSNIAIALIKRKKKGKYDKKTFDFVVGNVNKNGKILVIEKVGSISYSSKIVTINFFRLIFWLQHKPIILGNSHKFMTKFIFKKWKI